MYTCVCVCVCMYVYVIPIHPVSRQTRLLLSEPSLGKVLRV